MKRVGNIIDKIAEIENLQIAFCKAVKGKRSRQEVSTFQDCMGEHFYNIHRELLDGSCDFGDYRFFLVYEPKKRNICAAPFHDRVVHHAIMNIVEPIFDRYTIFDSYACRPEKGLHAAVKRAQFFSRKYNYYLKLDIAKYFDTIDHVVALDLIKRLIKDNDVIKLFEKLFASYESKPGKGMPIGNLISQHMANLYLGVFDHWIKEQLGVKGYLRYMDDFLIFSESKEELQVFLNKLQMFLGERLHLTLHHNRQLHLCRGGIPFLGYRIYPERVKLMNSSKNRFVRKFKQFEKKYIEGIWSEQKMTRHMDSLFGFVMQADTLELRRKVCKHSRVLTEEKMAITA